MASIKHALRKMDLVGVGLDAGIGYGTAYVIGRTYAQYGKTNWAARNGATLASIGGLGLSAISAVLGGPQLLTGALGSIGQTGVAIHGLNKGLQHGRDKAGKKAVLIDKGAALPPGSEAIGALRAARAGATPSWDQVAEMAGVK